MGVVVQATLSKHQVKQNETASTDAAPLKEDRAAALREVVEAVRVDGGGKAVLGMVQGMLRSSQVTVPQLCPCHTLFRSSSALRTQDFWSPCLQSSPWGNQAPLMPQEAPSSSKRRDNWPGIWR